jgi:lipopolysaccharide/colanic/teichoic acid biosynthesis glycosyltransferase
MTAALAKRVVDVSLSFAFLLVLAPLILVIAGAIKVESRGPVFYRALRVGRFGRPLAVLKFRKMFDGARGSALTISHDDRLTRVGRFLAEYKLDEIPQLWNVLRGQMSLVGPRPEDRKFVDLYQVEYESEILEARPGVTGLTQLAFAREGRLLATDDRERDYRERLLPRKIDLDRLYVSRRSLVMDLRIIAWTAVAIALGRDVSVNRETARLSVRRRPVGEAALAAMTPQPVEESLAAPPVLL